MKKLIPILAIIMFFLGKNAKPQEVIIPNDAIRLRVIANSDSLTDQNIKMKVRDQIQQKISQLLEETSSKEEAKRMVENTMPEFEIVVRKTLEKNKNSTPFTIDYGMNYFPQKIYKGITYHEGYYESLVITLGQGEGENWWCVLFPPLCLLESEETEEKTEVEYKFWIQEMLEKYL